MALAVDFSVSDAVADPVTETLAEDDGEVPECPQADSISLWAQQAFLSAENRVVSVQVVSEAEMQRLNRDWRGKDCATNVLSFPMQFDEQFDAALLEAEGAGPLPLGDIALCAAVINREATEQGKSATAHWAHMVVHGTLHLQGYDHIDDTGADEMEALEIQILQTLGFDNPYQTTQDEIQA
jgi:probable rRNA maturation factor